MHTEGRHLRQAIARLLRSQARRGTLGLQYNGKKNKIDHRPNCSKDLADALAGAVYHCSLAEPAGTAEAMMPSRGIVDTTEDIWDKLSRGKPITEQEFDKL